MKKGKPRAARVRTLPAPVADKLTPIYPLDLGKIHTIDDLVRAMGQTAYTARQIGDAADVLEAMARDKSCTVGLTLAGGDAVRERCAPGGPVTSWKLHQRIGAYLRRQAPGRGILKSAYEKKVPVYVPAFTDSELGLDLP